MNLDVHILTLPTANQEWVEQCVASVISAVAVAEFDVRVHVLQGVKGHVGEARANGYRQGTAEYVTHVDCDDYIAPNAFAVLKQHLEAQPDAVFTREMVVRKQSITPAIWQRHHLSCIRREIALAFPMANYQLDGDLRLIRHVEPLKVIDVDEAVYFWRRHDSDARKLIKEVSRG